jgi:hypothetical protein
MPRWVTETAGWVPAIVYPAATCLQLLKLLVIGSAAGVSISTWAAFGVGNFGMYLFTEKYWKPQSMGILVTAVMDFVIVGTLLTLS